MQSQPHRFVYGAALDILVHREVPLEFQKINFLTEETIFFLNILTLILENQL